MVICSFLILLSTKPNDYLDANNMVSTRAMQALDTALFSFIRDVMSEKPSTWVLSGKLMLQYYYCVVEEDCSLLLAWDRYSQNVLLINLTLCCFFNRC